MRSRSLSVIWIFDISPSSNSKLCYKVRHEVTDAAQSVFRTRVRGIIAGIKLKRLRVADIFFEKGTGCWSKIPTLAGKMHAGLQITREKIVRWGAEQGRTNNPPGSQRA